MGPRTTTRTPSSKPDVDPDDISSAKLDLRWRTMQLPAISPAERFQPALQEALAARALAAGGAEHIISGDDVDKLIADVMREDDRAVSAARQRCAQLRRDLDRAELTTAAAFAAAEIRSAEHITAQLDELDTELRVLQAASRYQPQRPLPMAPSAIADLSPAAATALTGTAALPFAVTVLHAAPCDERTVALQALHDAAAAANRNLLWCSPTQEQAATALAERLAPAAATVTETHAQISGGHTALPPGTLIVIDHAATADPALVADLAEHAATGAIRTDPARHHRTHMAAPALASTSRPAAQRTTVDRHTERPPQLRGHHSRHPARPRPRTHPEPPTAPEPARRPPQRQPHPRRPTPRRRSRPPTNATSTPPGYANADPPPSNKPRTSASATTTSRMRGTRGSVTFVFGGFSVFVPGLGTFCR